jgi:maltose/maltodextrin transport system permease protein
VDRASWIRAILIALFALPALYLAFIFYQSGNTWIALILLVVTCLGVFIYLNPAANTYRYLFPGLIGFGLFVIFPLFYTVYIGLTKYSSQNLLIFDRAAALIRNETFVSPNAASYRYKLFAQDNNQYSLYLEDEKNPNRRFASFPFELTSATQKPGPGQKVRNQEPAADQGPITLSPLPQDQNVKGNALTMPQLNRGKLMSPLRSHQFALPDGALVQMAGLTSFTSRERLWTPNPDGSYTSKKDGTVIHPDFKIGFFVNDKGEKVGVGFRTFSASENYARILTDPRIQGPFFRIFLWTVTFSALSVFLSFAVGMLLAVLLEQKDLRFRQAYRTLFILPYAVPAVLSILILKGLFNQQFGAVNTLLRGIVGFAPAWETNPWGARVMILLVNLWLGYPYMMLICTGMLQSIPSGIYEASAIDGSNQVIDFFQLTLPLVIRPMIPILISAFAFNFNNFNLIFLLTGGGPQMVGGKAGETDLLINYTYNIAFNDSGTNYGLASAIATLLFILVGCLAWINLRFTARRVKI